MEFLVAQILSGVSLGGQYALIAIGYTMVYGILRLINFAHGDVFMCAGLMMVFMCASLPVYVSIPLMLVLTVLLGFAIERAAYKPLRNAPRMSVMISAIGVRNLVENRVDLAKSRNVIVVSLIISLALGITFSAAGAITFHVGEFTLNFSGLAVAAIVGIVVNAILPGKDYDFQNDYEYGKTTEDHGQML